MQRHSFTNHCSQKRKYTCCKDLCTHPHTYNQNPSPKAMWWGRFLEQSSSLGVPMLLGKRRWPCSQSLVRVPGPSLELRLQLGEDVRSFSSCWLLLVILVFPDCNCSLIISPVYLILEGTDRFLASSFEPHLSFCVLWEAGKCSTSPCGFPQSSWALSLSSTTEICLVTEADCFHEAQKCNLPALTLQY